MLHIPEIPRQILGRDMGYLGWGKVEESLKIGHDHFRAYTFKLIIHSYPHVGHHKSIQFKKNHFYEIFEKKSRGQMILNSRVLEPFSDIL
jgi:hypothetical protein